MKLARFGSLPVIGFARPESPDHGAKKSCRRLLIENDS